MQQIVRFVDTPNGPLVVADAEPALLMNEVSARRLRRDLSRALGETPVLLRCQIGSSWSFAGDPSLCRYAVDPLLETLPRVSLDIEPPPQRAA